jgi:hypothetical protein
VFKVDIREDIYIQDKGTRMQCRWVDNTHTVNEYTNWSVRRKQSPLT